MNRKERGQGLVELAIITPLLLLLLLGMVELGALLRDYIVVVSAAREGARYGTKGVHTRDSEILVAALGAADSLAITMTGPDGELSIDGSRATFIVTRINKEYNYTYTVESQMVFGGDRPSAITDEWLARQSEASQGIWSEDGAFAQLETGIVAVELIYLHPQITGLVPMVGDPVPLHAMTVMRMGIMRKQKGDRDE